MGLLEPEEERSWAHARFRLSTVFSATMIITGFCFAVGLLFASRDMKVPRDNYLDDFYAFRRQFTNSSVIYIDEVLAATNDWSHPLNPIYKKNHIRYTFGSSFWNYCYLKPYPTGVHLPSLLRVMAVCAEAQVCFRTAVLLAIGIRAFCVLCRCMEIQKTSTSSLLAHNAWRLFTTVAFFSEIAASTFAMLVSCLHKENDYTSMGFLMEMAPVGFAVCWVISSVLFSVLEMLDRSKEWSTCWFRTRALCIIAFCACFRTVYANYLPQLATKSCHTHVPVGVAACEYVCIAAVAVFSYTQGEDFRNIEMSLSCELAETQLQPFVFVFAPAFRNYTSLPETKLKHKISIVSA
ncbi:unnamed protein product [Caenorhabditis auriculariae]|uniref:Uncharacterized protein n=1 Tax=Caenorhabditis auriculariae TaxID=2777116 RepID=A0A8S1H5N6_9PELO|nr:unnamed protein product [Caenorhabditis auriculariae]